MAPRIVNLAEWRAHLLDRLNRDIESTADPALIGLRDELADYPCPPLGSRPDTRAILVPLRLRVRGIVLSLFSTTTGRESGPGSGVRSRLTGFWCPVRGCVQA